MNLKDALYILRGLVHHQAGGKLEQTVLLAGLPRGGTTWLSEIINYRNHYRYIFEPFYPRYVPRLRGIAFTGVFETRHETVPDEFGQG